MSLGEGLICSRDPSKLFFFFFSSKNERKGEIPSAQVFVIAFCLNIKGNAGETASTQKRH